MRFAAEINEGALLSYSWTRLLFRPQSIARVLLIGGTKGVAAGRQVFAVLPTNHAFCTDTICIVPGQ